MQDRNLWPYANLKSLQDLLFQKAQMNFTTQMQTSTDRLFQDIKDPDREHIINLKELRDMLI